MMQYYRIIQNRKIVFTGDRLNTGTEIVTNPTHEQMLAAGWLVDEEAEPSAEELLQAAKTRKLAEIDAWDSSEHVNSFTLNGNPMWLDAATRQQLRVSIEAYQATGAEAVTKWFDGQEYTFPTAVWLQMLNALEVYAAEALNVTEAHRAAVSAMGSVEEVEAFDITADYPEKLTF